MSTFIHCLHLNQIDRLCSPLQLAVAAVLTTIYAVVQMMVFVGIIIQIAEEGYCSPTALFFFYVAGTFILAALLHPQEFFCVIHGFLYFLSIPSMYMLLMIYAMTNLHVVSWGTREVGIPQITLANMNQSWSILPDATMSQIEWQDCITQTNCVIWFNTELKCFVYSSMWMQMQDLIQTSTLIYFTYQYCEIYWNVYIHRTAVQII